MKTQSIVTPSPSVISANFIVEHKDFPLSIIPSVYNPHFSKICIVPKGWDYRQRLTVVAMNMDSAKELYPLAPEMVFTTWSELDT